MPIEGKYRTSATATGGRDGHVRSEDGKLELQLAIPKELGGPGGDGTNPEQLVWPEPRFPHRTEYDFRIQDGSGKMSRSKHTEAQMIAAVKQMEAGRKAEDVGREVGVSTHTIYAWEVEVRRDGRERGPRSQAAAG